MEKNLLFKTPAEAKRYCEENNLVMPSGLSYINDAMVFYSMFAVTDRADIRCAIRKNNCEIQPVIYDKKNDSYYFFMATLVGSAKGWRLHSSINDKCSSRAFRNYLHTKNYPQMLRSNSDTESVCEWLDYMAERDKALLAWDNATRIKNAECVAKYKEHYPNMEINESSEEKGWVDSFRFHTDCLEVIMMATPKGEFTKIVSAYRKDGWTDDFFLK